MVGLALLLCLQPTAALVAAHRAFARPPPLRAATPRHRSALSPPFAAMAPPRADARAVNAVLAAHSARAITTRVVRARAIAAMAITPAPTPQPKAIRKLLATRSKQAVSTLVRVALPTAIATIVGFLYFDNLSLFIRSTLDLGTIRILQADDAQFIQNFLTVIGLLFSILAGNAYSALYQQQESIYFALFQDHHDQRLRF